ncbi:MAG: glycosyltransferase [Thermoleophilaceae bacterium]
MSYTPLLGGAERILIDRAGALEGPVALACPEGELAERARRAGMQVVLIRERRAELRGGFAVRAGAPARLGAQSAEVGQAIARLRPACVVGWSMRGLLVSAAGAVGARSRAPLVFAHNDLAPSPWVARAVRAAASRADRVVALSRAIAEDLDPNARLGVEVIPPGIDLERFRHSPPPSGNPVVVVLGAIIGWKRPDLALEAVALAARELPGLRVRLAGAPLGEAGAELLARLRERADRPDLQGRVTFEGAVSDTPALLSQATCLLHCADREPFGLALAEALACGRGVAAPAAAGPKEIVAPDCGVLYEPGNASAAAAALVETVRRAPELSHPARERAARLYDNRKALRRFRAVIEEVTT